MVLQKVTRLLFGSSKGSKATVVLQRVARHRFGSLKNGEWFFIKERQGYGLVLHRVAMAKVVLRRMTRQRGSSESVKA